MRCLGPLYRVPCTNAVFGAPPHRAPCKNFVFGTLPHRMLCTNDMFWALPYSVPCQNAVFGASPIECLYKSRLGPSHVECHLKMQFLGLAIIWPLKHKKSYDFIFQNAGAPSESTGRPCKHEKSYGFISLSMLWGLVSIYKRAMDCAMNKH